MHLREMQRELDLTRFFYVVAAGKGSEECLAHCPDPKTLPVAGKTYLFLGSLLWFLYIVP